MLTCPLCSTAAVTHYARARDIEYHTSETEFDFYLCGPCGVLFINPMLSDRLGEIYPPNYYSFVKTNRSLVVAAKEWLDKQRFRQILRTLSGPEISVLDVGGGTGWLLDLIKSADSRVSRTSVIDIDANAGAQAELAGHRYYHGRIEEYDRTDRFDLVLMLNLIEHVSDPRAVLSKARTLLKPGGRLIIKTPNFDSLDGHLFRHRSWGGYHTPRHFVLFRKDSLEKLSSECGFQTVHFSYTQGAPFWSVSILEEMRRMGLVEITPRRPAIYHPIMPLLQLATAGFDFIRRPFAKLSQMEFVVGPGTAAPSEIVSSGMQKPA